MKLIAIISNTGEAQLYEHVSHPLILFTQHLAEK